LSRSWGLFDQFWRQCSLGNPGGARQGRAHPVDQTNVGVGDDQGRAGQAPGDQTTQEREPAGAVFAGDDVEAQHLAMALGVHAHGDHHGNVDDAATLTDLLGHGVERHIGVGAAIEGPVPERRHLAVDLAGHPGHLGLRQVALHRVSTSAAISRSANVRTISCSRSLPSASRCLHSHSSASMLSGTTAPFLSDRLPGLLEDDAVVVASGGPSAPQTRPAVHHALGLKHSRTASSRRPVIR
jgi:hypothetical protein